MTLLLIVEKLTPVVALIVVGITFWLTISFYKELAVYGKKRKSDMQSNRIKHDSILKKTDYNTSNDIEFNPDDLHQGLNAALSTWLADVENFKQCLKECGIMKDFEKYLLINDMDK